MKTVYEYVDKVIGYSIEHGSNPLRLKINLHIAWLQTELQFSVRPFEAPPT